MIVAIHAYENVYQGLHGIENHIVIECEDLSIAEEFAKEESIEVMTSYGSIIEDFEQEAEDEGLERETDEFDEYVSECIDQNVGYCIYEVVKPFGTLEEMQREFYNYPEKFIKDYCAEV